MSRKLIKVYFNNGCTTLAYNEKTTVEDLVKSVIKGRLTLNEPRYRACFRIRATKLVAPFNDFDQEKEAASVQPNVLTCNNTKYSEFVWLRNDTRLVDWLLSIGYFENVKSIDYWKLQLRIRCMPSDLNEVQFKDPITFNYYYEQLYNEFMSFVASSLTESSDLVAIFVELGCLEMRRSFKHMMPVLLDKKFNFDHFDKEVSLRRFFPQTVFKQKPKVIKKLVIKNLKEQEDLSESECVLKYLDLLSTLWRFDLESYTCFLGGTWRVPVKLVITNARGILIKSTSSLEQLQTIKFARIAQISTELNETVQIRLNDSRETLLFKMNSTNDVNNMASLLDVYCSLASKLINSSVWLHSSSKTSMLRVKSLTRELPEAITSTRKATNSAHAATERDHEGPGIENYELKSKDLIECPLIPADSLTMHEKLGSGQFGQVFRGTMKTESQVIEVAIKKLRLSENIDQDAVVKKFIQEAKTMQSFDHPHIIKIVGMSLDEEKSLSELAIVMELAKFGQLRVYLHTNRDHIETITLTLYCFQLSSALAYLESKKIVHSDIAARNILVYNHDCIKLSDFGLSRHVEDDKSSQVNIRNKLPIKWMAPESINFGQFTSQSDVWMFGVCAWEIFSFGAKPFQGIKNLDVVKLVEDKNVLDRPSSCPLEFYSVMLSCWQYESLDRPSFANLKDRIYSIFVHTKEMSRKLSYSRHSNSSSAFNNKSGSMSSNQNLDSLVNNVHTDTGSATNTMLRMMKAKENSSHRPLNNPDQAGQVQSQLSVKPKSWTLDGADKSNSSSAEELMNLNGISNHDSTVVRIDLAFRDQTLALIQNISWFIRSLDSSEEDTNTTNHHLMLDYHLRNIVISFNDLLDLIESYEEQDMKDEDESQLIDDYCAGMENCLTNMVNEFNKTNETSVEEMVKWALELARGANSLFQHVANNSLHEIK